ncbi:hypothetical protein PR202_gb29271 [Eleusine coracana subsp. coracana]|uniref:Uncharacterized protein n=1 Tax=Eleusine coracana subsp. coracana TaxID=191504 RepID=A0AAV5FZF8_ELECO|nr:hypothetical protein PR202_gb29271 [Eleusine coracana subsp. coracana]
MDREGARLFGYLPVDASLLQENAIDHHCVEIGSGEVALGEFLELLRDFQLRRGGLSDGGDLLRELATHCGRLSRHGGSRAEPK